MHPSTDRYRVRALSGPRAIALASTAVLGALGAFVPTPGATSQAPAPAQVDTQERTRLLELQRAAVARLQQAGRDGAPAAQVRRALLDASQSLQALGLTFQGSYKQTTPEAPAVGGHASAMGPAPPKIPSREDSAPVPVRCEEGARLQDRNYCGGPTKDHILESACGGLALFDYDGDGLLDIYFVTAAELTPGRERIPPRNALYHNLGNGRFEGVGLAAGVALNGDARAQAGMGADAGDYDGDGRMDFVITTFAHDRYTLYHNIDGRHFEDVSASAGIAGPTFVRMGWGTAFFDADLDGTLDLFFANGHIFSDVEQYPQLGETYRQKNQLLLNLGTRFRDVSERAGAGLQIARVGRGMAVGDLDNDGDLRAYFGLGDHAGPVDLEVRMPGGRRWKWKQLPADRLHVLTLSDSASIPQAGIAQ